MSEDFPVGLGERGQRMWRESLGSWSLTPAHLVLLEEACRTADRLDLLNAIILRSSAEVNSGAAEFAVIAGQLAEVRQQSSTLKTLLAEIRQGQSGAAPAPSVEGKGVADLTARIKKRRGQAPG
ncbi:hypothetical protein AB0M87_04485 [Streptomyces sp. NPDC051320]|uniref:hypothetical protein n=1 Tax=Streptomyces sp. NPDC051320 TaxID=3154644 RepID=UPI00342B4EFE